MTDGVTHLIQFFLKWLQIDISLSVKNLQKSVNGEDTETLV